jgi:hypothetical protein
MKLVLVSCLWLFCLLAAFSIFAHDRDEGFEQFELTKFEARFNEAKHVEVKWSGKHEQMISRFIIERSADGKGFKPIGFLPSQQGGNGLGTFVFIDESPFGHLAYYRLRTEDIDGRWKFYQVVAVLPVKEKATMYVCPNPLQGKGFSLSLPLSPSKNSFLRVLDTNGQEVYSSGIQKFNQYILPQPLAKGVYLVIVHHDMKTFHAKMVVD